MDIEIQLTRGMVAIIDAADLEVVSGYKWYSHWSRRKFYAATDARFGARKCGRRIIYMHRLIMGLPDSRVHTDHIDGDGLNNRRSNLRLCTIGENNQNQGILARNTSGYKGVSWNTSTKKWLAQISCDGKNRYIGVFSSKEEAHAAYCGAASKLHGEFANYG